MRTDVICPYCRQLAVYKTSSMHLFHGINYGPVYECDPCDARIGADPNTGEPKGTLANKPTRLLRQKAHQVFDPLWKAKYERERKDGCSWDEARTAGYEWLAKHLGIRYEDCHISRMQEDQLQVVIRVCELRLPAPRPPAPPEEVKS